MAWQWDAPLGVYRDNTLSSDIRKEAVADTVFQRFTRPESGFGVGKGQSVTITRVLQLPIAGKVAEDEQLPSGRPALQTSAVTVSEWGFKIEMTEFEKNLTYFDIMNPFQGMLRDQMSITMDKMVADAFKLTPLKFVPLLAGSSVQTGGTAGGNTADKNIDVSDLRVIRDYLRNIKVPSYKNGNYVGILSTRAARGIKNDPEYKDWFAPSTFEPFVAGQMKDCENFTLIETNHLNALADLIGASTVCGEAVFFGADSTFTAVVQNPELRAGIPQDLGRFREVGWVGTLAAGLTWDQAAQARVMHVTSA